MKRAIAKTTTNNQINPAKKLLRRATAARVLDTSVTMMKRLEAMGRVRPIRLGGRDVFYAASEIEALARGE
jgi:hypothetical protein